MRCLRLAASLSLIFCVVALADDSPLDYAKDAAFQSWCMQFCEKTNPDYLSRIYPTWRRNADYVAQQNRLELSYSVSLNRFAHLSLEDFSKTHLRPFKLDAGEEGGEVAREARAPPPDSVDWRNKGVVPPVQNQGQCGYSAAFDVVHAVDSFHAIQTGGPLLLASVEEYVDCCEDGSCDGGFYDEESYECIVRIGGLALASVYVSPEHKCLNNSFKPAIKIDGGRFLKPVGNETLLEYAVAMQPVVVAVDASHASFQLYEAGVYYEPDCSSTMLDHTMFVVGYGAMEDGTQYWICQNSWGTSWGMQGYIYMARNRNNNCGIASRASYPF